MTTRREGFIEKKNGRFYASIEGRPDPKRADASGSRSEGSTQRAEPLTRSQPNGIDGSAGAKEPGS